MDDEIERLVVSVRADTTAFARDVASMRGELDGGLVAGAGRAGRAIEGALSRAITRGKFGFEDLKKVALTALGEMAAASLKSLLAPPGAGGGGATLAGLAGQLIAGLSGAPGRATGGPVSQGRGYLVGERGPEYFVPDSAGRIVAPGAAARSDVRVAIRIDAGPGDRAQALSRSSRQVARAVRSALETGR